MTPGRGIPINVGEKLMYNSDVDKVAKMGDIAQAATKFMGDYRHHVGRLIVIDYLLEDDGTMQFHIFPNVPDHKCFYPNDQAFVKAVEKAVATIIGKSATVVAELHEEDGAQEFFTEDGSTSSRKSDTRVLAYYRNADGSHSHIKFKDQVPKLWFKVQSVPGLLAPREHVMSLILETVVEAVERLVSRP